MLVCWRPNDPDSAIDAVRDIVNMPLDAEPQRVRDDLNAVRARHAAVAPRTRQTITAMSGVSAMAQRTWFITGVSSGFGRQEPSV